MIKLKAPTFWFHKNLISIMLLPFSGLYILAGLIRQLIAKPIKLPCFVICIGNMTVGGAGKTQFVKWLVQNLNIPKAKILIITKAYGTKLDKPRLVGTQDLAINVGDESKLLSEYALVLASKSVKQALPLIYDIRPTIIVFDDGMQNPGFIKDLTILIIDSTNPVGNNLIFPAGPLRQSPISAITAADLVIFIGNNLPTNSNIISIITTQNKSYFHAKVKLQEGLDKSKHYYAFAGIAYPEKFFDILIQEKISVVKTYSFPDHHNYTQEELEFLQKDAKQLRCQLITTKKDWVKIQHCQSITYVDVSLILNDAETLLIKIYEKIKVHH